MFQEQQRLADTAQAKKRQVAWMPIGQTGRGLEQQIELALTIGEQGAQMGRIKEHVDQTSNGLVRLHYSAIALNIAPDGSRVKMMITSPALEQVG